MSDIVRDLAIPAPSASLFRPRLARRRLWGALFAVFCIAASLLSVAVLVVLIGQIVRIGGAHLSWSFLTNAPSRLLPESSGIYAALMGTIWVMVLTTAFAAPVGVGAAVYLHEYARKSFITRIIELNIANLAGVPSIVYGLLGLTIFVRMMTFIGAQLGMQDFNPFGRTVLSASLTMTLLVLPVIIIAAREALMAVPDSIRRAAYGVGATRWQTIWHHVLPSALPGVLTGMILALSRAIGEAAPLIVIGAATYIESAPAGVDSSFTVLPIQIFHWMEQPEDIYHELSAAAIIVLLIVLMAMNGLCVVLRGWRQRKSLGQ